MSNLTIYIPLCIDESSHTSISEEKEVCDELDFLPLTEEDNYIQYYLNMHFQNENNFWQKRGKTLPDIVLDHFSENTNPEFQRRLINYIFLLVAAGESYRNQLTDFRNQWEFSTKSPKYLAGMYHFIDILEEENEETLGNFLATSKSLNKEFSNFQNIRIWEYGQYMKEIFHHYEKYCVLMPEFIFDSLFEGNNYNQNRIRKFMEWYIPSIESIFGCIYMKINFLDENTNLLRSFFLAKNIKDVKKYLHNDEN